jgi:hypothetical protein
MVCAEHITRMRGCWPRTLVKIRGTGMSPQLPILRFIPPMPGAQPKDAGAPSAMKTRADKTEERELLVYLQTAQRHGPEHRMSDTGVSVETLLITVAPEWGLQLNSNLALL